MKTTNVSALTKMVALTAVLVLTTSLAFAQKGQSGTTLAASKTLDICKVDDLTWVYSGVVSAWNEGAVDTQGFTVNDWIQSKVSGPVWTNQYQALLLVGPVIPAGTTMETATIFSYSYKGAPLMGDIRNVATVTITNHSGSLGTPKGPESKATYAGPTPPPPCEQDMGCTYTQGYWGDKPNVVWPGTYSRDATFFLSAQTWQQVFDTPAKGNGYYILAYQYMAAVLNKANGAYVPSGVQVTIDAAKAWFESNPPTACSKGDSCGTQKTWGGILDQYNKGLYPGGPPHCE